MRNTLLAVVLLSTLTPLSAQLNEAVTIEVVEVPVYVTRGDQPVRGLTREDFELLVNGQPQTIDYFDVLDYKSATAEELAIDRRRLMLLLFDVASSEPWAIRKAQQAADKLVAESSPADWYAVATYTRKGLGLVLPFTRDRAATSRAIRSLSVSRTSDSLGLAMASGDSQVSIADNFSRDTFTAGNGGAFSLSLPVNTLGEQTLEDLEEKVRERGADDFLQHLTGLAGLLRPLQGNKSVIVMTQVLEPPMPDSVLRRRSRFAPSNAPRFDKSYDRFEELFERYRASGVILNAVDLNGVDKQTSSDIFMMSLSTGGFVAHGRSVETALKSVRDQHDITYLLGFRPPKTGQANNTIKVRVKDASIATNVRHRTGYSSLPGTTNNNPIALADVILNDIPLRGLGVDLNASAKGGDLAVIVGIDGREILAHRGDQPHANLEALVYVFDRNGTLNSWGKRQIGVDVAKARGFLEQNAVKIGEGFRVAAGDYTVKVVVRIAGTDIAGFARTEVRIGS